MMVTAVIGLSYMPTVLSSHGSGLSYLDCQATDTCSSHLQVKYYQVVNAGIEIPFSSWKKALSEIKVSWLFQQASSCTYTCSFQCVSAICGTALDVPSFQFNGIGSSDSVLRGRKQNRLEDSNRVLLLSAEIFILITWLLS